MIAMFDAFESYDLAGSDWNVLGEQLYKLRTHGVTVPLADAIIASTAIKYSIPVWTSDKHFTLMQGVFPALKLYQV